MSRPTPRPTQPPIQWIQECFPGVKWPGSESDRYLYLLSRLGMNGATPSLPLSVFICAVQLYFYYHMVRHPRCVFINYNWINQLSNTTIWWLDICCLLHRYQIHVSALMAIFRLIDWQQTCKQLYFGMRLVYGGGGLGLDGGKRSRVCWVGRVMWVHGYYCADLGRHNSTHAKV